MNETNYAEIEIKKIKNNSKFSKFFLCIGAAFVMTALVIYFFVEHLIKYKIYQNLLIQNGSQAYQFWLSPPVTILRKYYFFDVKNPKQVEKGAKPILIERGPYTYSETWTKKNLNFINPNLLQFSPVFSLKFEPSLSNGTLSDKINFLNIPALATAEKMSNEMNDFPFVLNTMFSFYNIKLYQKKTVNEIISGYEDNLLLIAKNVDRSVKDSKFSLLNGKNGTAWTNFTIRTGLDDVSKIGQIVSWNNIDKLSFWDSDNANMINGSDGTSFHPFLSRKDKLTAFSPELCRSYSLEYLKDNEIDGVKTFDFHLPPNIFANHTNNPDNFGFCPDGKCLGNGVLNISKCYGGVSAFVSQPHFLNADESFQNSVSGLKPDPNKHDYILHFEPTTSAVMRGKIRLQINFYLNSFKKFDLFKNIKPVLLPLIWLEEDIELNPSTKAEIEQAVFIINFLNILPFFVFPLGIFFLLCSFLLRLNIYRKKLIREEFLKSNHLFQISTY